MSEIGDQGPMVDDETMGRLLLSAFHPDTRGYIGQLVATSLYGTTPREVIVALVDESIRSSIKNGFIKVQNA